MELRQLRYFLAVAEELHFGRAAKRVHISQPPLSQQIRQLEDELRCQLFYRTKRKVELTEAGRAFAGEARVILQQVNQAAGMALGATRSKLSRLVVGCSPANTHVVLPILKTYAQRNPKVHVVVKSLVSLEQAEALRIGRIDVGFVTLPLDSEGLSTETILRERLLVAMRRKHPLASRRRVALRALSNETLIVFPLQLSPGRYDLITGLCRGAGFSLHVIHEVDNLHAMLELIGSGFGVSLMRASVQNIPHHGVVFRELQHSPVVETALAYRRGNPPEILSQFMEVAKEIAAPFGSCES